MISTDGPSQEHSQDEALVLASILVDPDCFADLSGIIRPEMFYRDWHREVWQAMQRLDAKHAAPDVNAVTTELQRIRTSGIDETNAFDALLAFANEYEFAATIGAPVPVAERVRENYQRREVARQTLEIRREAGDPMIEPKDLLPKIDELAFVLDDGRVTVADPLMTVAKVKESFDRAIEIGEPNGWKSGHWLFDSNSLGFVPGSIGVEAAGTGEGKTHNLWHRCRNFKATSGQNAGLISGEMTEEELVERQIVGDGNVASAVAQNIEAKIVTAVHNRLQAFAQSPIEIVSPPSMSLDDVLSSVRHLARHKQCKLVCIDYAQMIHVPKERDPNEAARKVYGELKALAMRMRIAIVMASQFNKAGRREAAKLSPLRITEADIYGSSHASYYAHTIVHAFRLSVHEHHSEIQRISRALQDLGIDPSTVTIERVIKSRRGQKQHYTMASRFDRWAMKPLSADAHTAIRKALSDEGNTNAGNIDPKTHFENSPSSTPEAFTPRF